MGITIRSWTKLSWGDESVVYPVTLSLDTTVRNNLDTILNIVMSKKGVGLNCLEQWLGQEIDL